MKQWKQFVSILLVFAMLISFLPVTARAEGTVGGTCGDNLTWTFDEASGMLTISGTGDMYDYGSGAAPWREFQQSQILGITVESGVTSIGMYGLADCVQAEMIQIADSVTKIGAYAFINCGNVAGMVLPKNLTSLGEGAFWNMTSLNNITIPDGITEIPAECFIGCGLTCVVIPASVTAIGDMAFGFCNKLAAVYYMGPSAQWNAISVGEGNEALDSVDLYYDYVPDETIGGTYGDHIFWELLDGVLTISGTGSMGDSASADGYPWYAYRDEITQIVIGDGVLGIGASAFYGYKQLKSVELGSGLHSIASRAFANCTNLVSVSYPKCLENIGDSAFAFCSSLKDYPVDSNLTWLGLYAFKECSSLTTVSLPDELGMIREGTFMGCSGITELTVPGGITSIGAGAFSACTGLKQIHFTGDAPAIAEDAFEQVVATALFPGGNPTWTSSVMKDYGGTLTWSAEGDAVIGSNLLSISNGVFDYYSRVEEDVAEYTFTYDESWFLEPATTYNHDLAKMTFRVALAAADTDAEFIEALFRTLEMKNLDTNYPAPSLDTIGYTMGHKLLRDETGREVTLIAVAVRGGGYEREWASNFTIGSGLEHYGFRTCAGEIYGAIQRYINNQEISGDLCIWVTGYSRAAAVSNILAHKLNTAADSGTIAGLSRSGVFAYCFECPRTVQDDAPGFTTLDNNVFNIVNPVDLVPMVAPEKWDFNRYGITYYLPSSEINYKGFSDAFAAMQAEYRNIRHRTGSEDVLVSDLTETMDTQNKTLQTLIDALASGIGSQDTYQNEYQTLVRAAIEDYKNGDLTAGEVIVVVLSLPIIGQIPKVAFLIPGIIKEVSKITHAHYPELCMAWLDSLDGSNLRKTVRTRYLTVNCPVNVSVYDSTGTLVAQITNDVVQEIEGSTIGAVIDENGQKVICLPLDEEFRIETTATADGTVSWQVEEYDIAAGEATRVINYYDIAITEGDILNGTAGTGVETDAQYSLTAPDGEKLNPSNELTAEEIVEHDVTVSSEGNGTVIGGGLFVTGEHAMVMATPDESESFLGWYVDDTLVSTETEYRFRVEADVQILGKFTQTVPSVIRLSGKNRYDTAFAVANQLKSNLKLEQFEAVVVAYGQNFPDALTGSYLAAVKNAPILLTEKSADARVLAYIEENLVPGGTVYILGGTAAVTQEFEDGANELGFTVKRLKDKNRYGTNLKILEEAGVNRTDEILIATGTNYADSLSASATGLPMLLVGGSLTEEQKAFLKNTSGRFVIIGGTGAVSQKVEDQLNEIGTAERVKGKTRYETSVVIAQRYFGSPKAAVLAYAQGFPDGLCGGPLAMNMGAPLILTSNESPAAADAYIEGVTVGAVTGGTGRITDDTVRAIFDLAEDTEIPVQ